MRGQTVDGYITYVDGYITYVDRYITYIILLSDYN